MKRVLAEPVEAPACPKPYRLRRGGIETHAAWLALLNTSGEFGTITTREFKRSLIANLVPSGVALLEHDAEIVAAAATCMIPTDAPSATLMYVVVSPPHRGRGLGTVVTAHVLAAAAAFGCPSVVLRTDDDRLAAIRTYLKLGFTPVREAHASHHGRWVRVLSRIASTADAR